MVAVLPRVALSRSAAAGAALFAGAATLLAGPAPAYAETVYIQVNPSTVAAGYSVSLRARCGSTVNPAEVTSDAFGTVTLLPQNGLLVGTATVPDDKLPHGYPVRLTCATGAKATTTLWVISRTSRPPVGPDTGGGYLAHQGRGGQIMIMSGLAAVGAGGVLALWTTRRRRAARL